MVFVIYKMVLATVYKLLQELMQQLVVYQIFLAQINVVDQHVILFLELVHVTVSEFLRIQQIVVHYQLPHQFLVLNLVVELELVMEPRVLAHVPLLLD
jgi:hypothetical protein